MTKHVIVAGAGIIGATIAWNLARAGADVLVLDGDEPGGIATPRSWAWINASWGNPEPYFRLRRRSMALWRELDRDVPGLAVNWCGGLLWDLEPAALKAYAKEQGSWGYGTRLVSRAEALQIEPNLNQAPDLAVHVAEEGVVEPAAATAAILAAAKTAGASVISKAHIKWLEDSHGRVSAAVTEEGALKADEIILATGTGTPAILKSIGLSLGMSAPPGLLSHSEPAPDLLKGLVMTPGLHVRQTAEGRLVAGTDFTGTDPGDDPEGMARGLHAQVQTLIRGSEEVPLAFHTVGYRPTPADGFPAVGRFVGKQGLYVAVTHSGVTLAPAIGAMVAREILEGVRDPLLGPYGPDRLAGS